MQWDMSLTAASLGGDGDAGRIEGGRNEVPGRLDRVPRLVPRRGGLRRPPGGAALTYQQTVRPDLRG